MWRRESHVVIPKCYHSPDVVQRIIFVVDSLILKCSIFDCLRRGMFGRAGLMAAIYQGDRKESRQHRHRALRIRTLSEILVCTFVRRLDPVCNKAMVKQSRLWLTMWRASG